MLISRVPEEGAEGRGEPGAAQEVAHNYQTASELFELMSKNHDFEAGDDALTNRDLVLLYKNIDLGKQLMSSAHELKRPTPNQYVEEVRYHDEAETDSDLSETYSSEDLHTIMLANKERIDLLTNKPSLNSLCHKLGDLEIQVSNVSTNYDRRFLFKDPYINEQLNSLQLMSKTNELDTSMLPTSLLDYICCKRLEDNYNFYMDNIITYVKHTIEQLKRISNGDYLPERVKEKWRELERDHSDTSKVLTTSTSIPLQVERKVTGLATTWDEIVHSEVDLRSLIKILEKKIVLEVPKMICGSYKLFSKFRADNLVISCKRKNRATEQKESRVDVVVQLQRSNTGQVLGNIDSIMILQPQQQIAQKDRTNILPLAYDNVEQPETLSPKVIELSEIESFSENKTNIEPDEVFSKDSVSDCKIGDYESQETLSSKGMKPGAAAAMTEILSSVSRVIRTEAAANHASPNNLHFSMTNLKRQGSPPEEGAMGSLDFTKTRKKSSTRIRIKSPYENKSAILEERKRRRLLELRERREKRKMALSDTGKVAKHNNFPQAVSSVTKLSITNKSFYNSIYGRNFDSKRVPATSFNKIKGRKEKQDKDGVIEEIEQESEGERDESESAVVDRNGKKNINSHFLDDADTEMSNLQKKMNDGLLRISTSTSVVSNESASNLFYQSATQSDCCPSLTNLGAAAQESPETLEKPSSEPEVDVPKTLSELNKAPATTPKSDYNGAKPAIECRRSLEKICTLMNKLREIDSNETTSKKKTSTSTGTRGPLTSESGTSLYYRVSYTNPSWTSFDKPDDQEINMEAEEIDRPTTVVPKVVISTKPGMKTEETKKDRKAKAPRIRTIPENPLKAISQLLHEFDNVQKSRQKIADPKSINRSMSTDARSVPRPELQKRRSRIESTAKEDPLSKVTAKVKTRFTSREEMRPEVNKPHILDKKNINDLIDEAKEARGEAVRGPPPPKFSSRLNTLAQPKRYYVQALNEEFTRRQTPERAPREAAHAPRPRRREVHSPQVYVKSPHSLERTGLPRRSAGSSPDSRVRDPSQIAAPAAAASTARPAIKKKAGEGAVGGQHPLGPDRLETTRTPVLPSDLELLTLSSLSSPTTIDVGSSWATCIGSKLHRIVQSTVQGEQRASRPCSAPRIPADTIPPVPEEPCPDQHDRNQRRNERLSPTCNALTPVNSISEIKMLEHAIHRRLSSGTFPGRLRIKKLTLTPKPSLQQCAMHQAGDTTSLVFKSDESQKITLATKLGDRNTDLLALFNCGLYAFPLQISTIGYAFPVLQGEMKPMIGERLLETTGTGTTVNVNEEPDVSRVTTVLEIQDEVETCRYIVEHKKPTGAECAVQVTASDDFFVATNTTRTIVEDRTIVEELCAPSENDVTSTTEKPTIISDSSNTARTLDIDLKDHVAEDMYELSDYTASLDMLVGLLNEIQKIATITDDAPSGQIVESGPRGPFMINCDAAPAATGAAFDELRMEERITLFDEQIEIIIPSTEPVCVGVEVECKPVYEDKEVWARIAAPQHHVIVNTDPEPTHEHRLSLSPHHAGTSTINIPKLTCSMATIKFEYNDAASNTSQSDNNAEQTGTNRNLVKSLVPFYDNIFKVENARRQALVTCENMLQYTSKKTEASIPGRPSENCLNKCDEVQLSNDEVIKHDLKTRDSNCSIRMKRDVLVTFYSILVLTVFVALAFPEMQFLQQA